MLINLSNHPSANWSEQQIEAAKEQFGNIKDLPFPQIDPSANPFQVAKMAENYFNRIRKMFNDAGIITLANSAVHIMGELTFCHVLIGLLHKKGYKCVASTTERSIIEEKDGRKTAQFTFVQFREYT